MISRKREKTMIIMRRKNKFYTVMIILFTMLSCTSTKPLPIIKRTILECPVTMPLTYTIPKSDLYNEFSLKQWEEFTESTYEFQLLYISQVAGYRFVERSELIFLENNKFYKKNEKGEVSEIEVNYEDFDTKLKLITKKDYQIVCDLASSATKARNIYI